MAGGVKHRILAEIRDDEVVELAKDLVRIPSYTTEETPVAEFLHGFLTRNGLDSRLQEVDPGRFQTIGRLPGSGGGNSLMLNGHIDIDPIPGGWVRDATSATIADTAPMTSPINSSSASDGDSAASFSRTCSNA